MLCENGCAAPREFRYDIWVDDNGRVIWLAEVAGTFGPGAFCAVINCIWICSFFVF